MLVSLYLKTGLNNVLTFKNKLIEMGNGTVVGKKNVKHSPTYLASF
jgi:hypothetical protein